MTRTFKLLALGALLIAHPALAQNAASGSPRVQGAPDGFGDPVQVTIVGPNGADITGTTAFGTSVPIAIRDGAGGTVIFALSVPTAGFLQPVSIVFETPLQGTANTLLEVVTTTANTSGTAWVNCQGHTGS